MKDLLMKELEGNDTTENRKKLAEKEAEKFKAQMVVPTEVEKNIHEGFEPLLASADIIDDHFLKVLNAILDFPSSNSDA